MSMIGVILGITLPIAIVVFIFTAIVRSVKKDNTNEESFQNIIRGIYIYLVMIIFLLLIVGSTISLFNSCLELILPETSQKTISLATTNTTIAEVTTNITLLCISIPMFLYYSILAKKDFNKLNIKSESKEIKKEEVKEIKEEIKK